MTDWTTEKPTEAGPCRVWYEGVRVIVLHLEGSGVDHIGYWDSGDERFRKLKNEPYTHFKRIDLTPPEDGATNE